MPPARRRGAKQGDSTCTVVPIPSPKTGCLGVQQPGPAVPPADVTPSGSHTWLLVGSVIDSFVQQTSVEELLLAEPCSRYRDRREQGTQKPLPSGAGGLAGQAGAENWKTDTFVRWC